VKYKKKQKLLQENNSMQSNEHLKTKTGSLGRKIFSLFTAFVIVLYLSFSAFFIYFQGQILKNHLIEEGRLLSNMIAYNLRLGVFAENKDLLQGPVESIMQFDEAILVQVFTSEGRQLKSLGRGSRYTKKITETAAPEMRNSVFNTIRHTNNSVHFKGKGSYEFWAPVTSGRNYSEEDMFFSSAPPKEYIIGFVRIVITTHILDANLREVAINSILIPVLFIIPGWLIAYYIVIRITRPLKRLTQGVKAIGTDEPFENVPVETNDEIGNLAMAFNEMAVSLKTREAEKQELEEQLRQAQKMEAVGTLAGGIAHDFNNIISVIRGYGHMLQKNKGLDVSTINHIDQIVASSNKAAALTRRLLTFGRKQIINPEPVNINDIILNVEPMLQRLITQKIQLSINLSNIDLIVVADTIHLEQVMMNLVSNARDAMPGGGSIIISTNSNGPEGPAFRSTNIDKSRQYASISIADTGTGIEKDVKEKIFDPFFTTKEAGEGTGLGLSVVYGIIKQHKGFIEVETVPGKGSTFNIFLPLS